MVADHIPFTKVFLMLVVLRTKGMRTQQCSCYYFHDDKWSRNMAHYKCETEHSAKFVSMETLEEWTFIQKQLKSRTVGKTDGNQWYIGLEMKNGTWKWSSGQNLTYKKWSQGMPDNKWWKRFTVMTRDQGLFQTTNDIIPKARICEKKINTSGACVVHWCPPSTSPTTPMTSVCTSTSDHNQGISVIMPVKPTQGIHPSTIPTTLLTTDRQSTLKTQEQSSDTTMITVLVVVLMLVLFCIALVVILCQRAKKDSRLKREKQQLQQNESFEMEPRENTSSHGCGQTPPTTAAQCTNIHKTIPGDAHGNTCKAVSIATDDVYASVDDDNDNGRNMNLVEAEYAEVKDVLRNVTKDDPSMATEAGYATVNINNKVKNRNVSWSLETETEYATVDKDSPSNENEVSMETKVCCTETGYASVDISQSPNNERGNHKAATSTDHSFHVSVQKGRSYSSDSTVQYAVVDKTKKNKRSESQSVRDHSGSISQAGTASSADKPVCHQEYSPVESSVQYAVVDKTKKNKRIQVVDQPHRRGQTLSIAEVENSTSIDVSSEQYSRTRSHSADPTLRYAVVDNSRKRKPTDILDQRERAEYQPPFSGDGTIAADGRPVENSINDSGPEPYTLEYALVVDQSEQIDKSKSSELTDGRERDECQALREKDLSTEYRLNGPGKDPTVQYAVHGLFQIESTEIN